MSLLTVDRRNETGPFDIIGDVHGCFDELYDLLLKLAYDIQKQETYTVKHPEGRKLVFVGDLVDRGLKTPEVLRLVMDMVESGMAYCVVGNHEDKLRRKLQGRDVKVDYGLSESLEQLESESPAFKEKVIAFLQDLPSHCVLDNGRLAVVHAALKAHYIGDDSPYIKGFCMYGPTAGVTDEYGLPVRYPWAKDYRGDVTVIYGHSPVLEAVWINNTMNIDTGCVFGGKLTALRYPEKELVSVPAKLIYKSPVKPIQ